MHSTYLYTNLSKWLVNTLTLDVKFNSAIILV